MALPPDTLAELVELLVASGVTRSWLDRLFGLLPPACLAALPDTDVVRDRLARSLAELSRQTAPIDGAAPLAIVLDQLALDPDAAVAARAKQLLNRLAAAGGGAAAAPLEASLGDVRLVGAALLAGRAGLRATLRRLAACGAPHAGAPHGRPLLARGARRSSVFHLAWCEIQPEQEAQFTADWLIEDLVHAVVPGAGAAPPRREPPARWLSELVSWASAQLAQLGDEAMVWLVIDGAGRPGVASEVRGVVERLAARVAAPTGPVALRLILAGCDPAVLGHTGRGVDPGPAVPLTGDEAAAYLQGLLDPPPLTARRPATGAGPGRLGAPAARGVAAELEWAPT